MSISLNANFELLSAGLYLDARQQFNTIIEMKDFAETSIPDGFITYNKETQKHYVFSSSNTVDATLGKWREYNSGDSSSTTYATWNSNVDYKVGNVVLKDEVRYSCIADHTSTDFETDSINWVVVLEQYYHVTQEQYNKMVSDGLITDGTKDLYIIDGNSEGGNSSSAIYTSLSELGLTAPITVGEIFNAMPDKTMAVLSCEDIANHITDVPTSYGVLTIKKNNARFSIEYQNSLQGSPCNVKRWIGTLKGSDGTGLYWKQLSAEPTFVTLNDIGVTADATFQDVVDALPKGGSALLGVKDFTNYQTIFPYEEGNDQFARVYIVKGLADGSAVYARWFRKDGSKEAIASFNTNDNKFGGWQMLKNQQVYTSIKELGLDTTATINDIVGAMKDGTVFTYKTDVFDYATEYNNLQYATVSIHKQSTGRIQVLMTDKNTGNLYVGRMDTNNLFVGWRSCTFHRVVTQATAGYFKFKPTSDGGFEQPLRISVTDNYGGMIDISGNAPTQSMYKPFKCIRLSNGEYTNYDAIKVANNKMLKLFYYDGYFYLKVAIYTTCTFTGLLESPTYVETFNETDAEEIPIRSVFDISYNDGYADPSIIAIGDTGSADGVIKTLGTLGFTGDVMTWYTGEYRISHVGDLTNLPAEITEEKPGFRLAHYDMKKWGSNHNPYASTYGCRQSVLHYKGDVFVRYTESGATPGVLIVDTGWRKIQTGNDKATLVTNTATLKLDVTKKNASWYGAIKLTHLYDTSPVEIEITFRSATDNLRWAVINGQKYINGITFTQDDSNTAHYTIGIQFTGTTYGCYQAEVIGGFADINSLTSEAFTGAKTAIYNASWGKNNGVSLVSTPEDIGLTYPCTTVQLAQAMRNKFNITINAGAIGIFNHAKNTSVISDAPSDYGLLHIETFGFDRILIRFDGIGSSSYVGSWIGQIKSSNGTFSSITWSRIDNDTRVTTLETQVSELFQSVSDGKTLVANAITGKGVSTSTSATFATMATNISKIPQSVTWQEETVSASPDKDSRVARFVFSNTVLGVRQMTAPGYNYTAEATELKMFTINGNTVEVKVESGRWKMTAMVKVSQ